MPEAERARIMDVYAGNLATTGCIVKHVLNTREFAGFRFVGELVEPLYPDKHKFALAHVTEDALQETLISYFLLYSKAGNFGWMSRNAHLADFPVGPWMTRWADGVMNARNALKHSVPLYRDDEG